MKIRSAIYNALEEALEVAGLHETGTPIVLERPREGGHGDMSTPLAMSLAKIARRKPMDIASDIVSRLNLPSGMVESVEVLKPGFINFRFAHEVLSDNLLGVLSAGDSYGSSDLGAGRKYQVEYVSANPTGPLVIVSARAAAVGSVIVNLLRFAGFSVESEYYVNDHGGQVNALGQSLQYRIRERLGLLREGEEIGAYPGEYLEEIARGLSEPEARRLLEDRDRAARCAIESNLTKIKQALDDFGVEFDNLFFESSLHPAAVDETQAVIEQKGFAYEKDGAVYFRSTDLGDDKDRVLRKSDGSPTYFLADVAYHRDKLRRGFTRAVGLLGPDHHGHVPRMKAAMSVLGAEDEWLEIIQVGWVRLLEQGKPVSMSKRAGEFISMRDLIEDVGSDVAKYFFLMRRSNSPLDFDLTLARKQSEENPVYYVQYAHARISSVTRFARGKGCSYDAGDVDLKLLNTKEERELMLHLLYFPHVVEGAALSKEPHRLTIYAQDLATAFHQFYHERRVVSEDAALSSARLLLAEATQLVLKNSLRLLGVSAPSSM